MRGLAVAWMLFSATVPALAQRSPDPEPALQGAFILPIALHNPGFDDLTAILGQVDACFQLPVVKGIGWGIGVNATFYELNEHGTGNPISTIGNVDRMLLYGKVNYMRYTGPVTFYQFDAKFGYGVWDWDCSTCAVNVRQPAIHWGLDAGYYFNATKNLAFGLIVGYEGDGSDFGPEVIGLEDIQGHRTGSPYRFLTIGLGFSTGFQKTKDGMW